MVLLSRAVLGFENGMEDSMLSIELKGESSAVLVVHPEHTTRSNDEIMRMRPKSQN